MRNLKILVPLVVYFWLVYNSTYNSRKRCCTSTTLHSCVTVCLQHDGDGHWKRSEVTAVRPWISREKIDDDVTVHLPVAMVTTSKWRHRGTTVIKVTCDVSGDSVSRDVWYTQTARTVLRSSVQYWRQYCSTVSRRTNKLTSTPQRQSTWSSAWF